MYQKEFEYILNYAADKSDDIEILLAASNSFTVRIHKQNIEGFNYADTKGIGVRLIRQGKIGYAYTDKFTPEAFRMIVDEAIANSIVVETDDIVILENYPDVDHKPEVYSPELDTLQVSAKVDFARQLENIALSIDERIINVPNAVFGDARGYWKIVNSRGLSKEDRQNYAYSYVSTLAAQDNDKRMAVEFHIGRDFSKFKAEQIARNCVKKSIDLLGGEILPSGTYPVVFNNEMMTAMLGTFSGLFSAKNVQEGKSLLKDKLGKTIADSQVTLIDDALHPAGYSTRAFDSEGYPSQKTILIDSGVLNSYLHNTITARKDNRHSTGNATRSYKGTLQISPSNLYLVPGSTPAQDLFARHQRAVEIVALQGMHSGANIISGDFSLSAEGFLWENGKRLHSLKQFTVSGNILQLLQNVQAVADDFKFDINSVGAPSVLVAELNLGS